MIKHKLVLLAHQLDWKPGTFSWRGSRFLPLTSLGWMGRETLKTLILSLQLSRFNSLLMTSKSVSPPYPHWPTLSMQLAGLTGWIVSSYCIILADWLAGCGESVIICGVVLIVMLFVLQDVVLPPSCSQTCECVTGLMTYPSWCYGLLSHLSLLTLTFASSSFILLLCRCPANMPACLPPVFQFLICKSLHTCIAFLGSSFQSASWEEHIVGKLEAMDSPKVYHKADHV